MYTEKDIFKMYQFGVEGKLFEEAKKEILHNRIDCDEGKVYTILDIVCGYYNITYKQMRSRSRLALYINARRAFCFLCRKFTGKSLNKIGKIIDRDHASVLHQTKNVQDSIFIEDKLTIKAINEITLLYYESVVEKNKKDL